MKRLIFLLLVIFLLSLGLSWIADEPGQVTIYWGVHQIEMSLLTLIAATAFLALLCSLLYAVFYLVLRSPKRWSQTRNSKRQTLGITALTETFAAIATQDVRHARKHLKRAQALLPNQPLTLMLASQVARLEGNDSQSQLYLEQMSKSEVTEFLALRGLIENARRAGDVKLALQHAEKAYALKPQDHWLATTLIGLYAKTGRTQEALRIIEKAGRRRVLQSQEMHQLRAGVLLENATIYAEQRQFDAAIVTLKEALRRHPKFTPAIVALANVYIKKGDASMALKVAGDGWRRVAHPEITEALLHAYAAAKDEPKAAKVLRKLAKLQTNKPEAQILLAKLAMEQGEFKSASGLIRQLMQAGETARLCSILADIEDAAGDSERAAHWHKQAKTAPAEALWSCAACKRPANAWEITCGNCGAVGAVQ